LSEFYARNTQHYIIKIKLRMKNKTIGTAVGPQRKEATRRGACPWRAG
jgi:hypothetical protein